MADPLYGFSSEIPAFEDEELSELDPSLTNLAEGDEYDQLNDDTFGDGALEDDWEFGHRKLAGLPLEDEASERAQFEEWLKKKGLGSTGDGPGAKFVERNIEEDFEDDLDREEEILEQNLTKLVDDDDGDSIPVPKASSKYKDIKHPSGINPAWDGTSPLSSPTSATSLHDLISPSSNIWGSPSKLDKENTNKGPANTQSPLAELLKAEGEKKHVPSRPFSPAFEDDSIVQAVPRQSLIPPSRFTTKPHPANAIKLEDLEKELTTGREGAPQQVPEVVRQTPHNSMIGRPPPGIPRPMMTPPGFSSPVARMSTPRMPPQMFQQRPNPSKHPMPSMSGMPGMPRMPGMPGPSPHLMRTPRTPHYPRHPFPMVHSDPGHLMMRGGMMNFPLSPHHQRFSSPQFPNRRFQDPRQNYQRQHYDGRMSNDNHSPRQQDRGEHHHQFTDLEKKIHSILTAAESGPNRFDPYAGIMSRREKEWLIKIQLLQLTSNEPELDDYYFQTYTRRKAAKERSKQSEGVQQNVEDNRASGAPRNMALPQFEREKKSYTPLDFQGTLGKVSSSSVQHPRQMVDLMHLSKASEQEKQGSSTPLKDTKRRSQLLLNIEKGYDYLLNIESLEKRLILVGEKERKELYETRQNNVKKLFDLLKLSTEGSSKGDDELFVQFTSVSKGKRLLCRALSLFSTVQMEAVLMAITRNISSLIKKDNSEQSWQHLMVPLNRACELASPSVVIECLKDMVSTPSISNSQGSLSAVLLNQFGVGVLSILLGRAAVISSSLTESDDDMRKSWLSIVSQVASKFQDLPVKQLGRNLVAADRLVALLSTCTDVQTKALLQEHLRLAASAKSEISA
ncbi:protein PAT1 homolog 1-like [Stylophora pistillata]|uniref:protein PAT1 homolog 1-like n=1 Tax=Stylophora pistillata TaxID=50429 RepID=UPI000C043E5D|nr:protein PAT1 homolog 1-like [Stylophora pistillata]